MITGKMLVCSGCNHNYSQGYWALECKSVTQTITLLNPQ
jgi:hypothetical protein